MTRRAKIETMRHTVGGGGGFVELRVSVDWLTMDPTDRHAVEEMVDAFREWAKDEAVTPPDVPLDEEPDDEGEAAS